MLSLELSILITIVGVNTSYGDFVFADFRETTGLVFNGDAAPTDCGRDNLYVSNISSIEYLSDDSVVVSSIGEENGIPTKQTHETNNDDALASLMLQQMFGHRESFAQSISTGCSTRLRLTPSAPSKAGSIWYGKRLPIVSCNNL